MNVRLRLVSVTVVVNGVKATAVPKSPDGR